MLGSSNSGVGAQTQWLRVFSWISLVVAAVFLAGCASTSGESQKNPAKIQTLWPEPPEQPRFRYLQLLRTLADVRPEEEDERLERILTGRADRTTPLYEKPNGLAARGGRIYVADPASASVVVFDVPRRRAFRFGQREPHLLQRPNAIALDEKDKVYVLDTRALKVLVFDSLGLYLSEIVLKDRMTRPVGIAASQNGERIYVVDRGSLNGDDHRVVVFSADGKVIQELGPRGEEDGRFNIPVDAEVAGDGSLVVLDSGNFRIQIFDAEGNFIRSFGEPGVSHGQFARARGLAVDAEGNIYVSDANFNNVQVFNFDGELLLALGRLDLTPGPGHFGLVGALATDEKGFIYVADQFHKKVEVYRLLSDEEGRRLLATN